MPAVGELSAVYENFLLTPQLGPGVCADCFNLTEGYERCYACSHGERLLSAVLPISYSVAHEQLHHALASYKRLDGDIARRLATELAAVLWRFLAIHEECAARAAGVASFPVVATVPSSDPSRDAKHPLAWIVGELVGPTRTRYERLLRRSDLDVGHREFEPEKYLALRMLDEEAVLLIDDTWTTGANAQCAAAALRRAGAGPVAAVVIGRHVNRDWNGNNRQLRELPCFDWEKCALCADQLAAARA
jgi:hypothetical protein